MPTGARHTTVRGIPRLLGALAAALAVSFLSPATARAECGDYVHVGHGVRHATTPAGKGTPAPQHPAPCHGPNCQRAPDHPPFAPPAPAPTSVDQPACLAVAAADQSRDDVSHVFDHVSHVPPAPSSRLERPPRV